MTATARFLFAVLIVGMTALAFARADKQPLAREDLSSIREATRDLAREVEFLQDIIAEQTGLKDRELYRQADAVQAHIADFQKSLKLDVSRDQRYVAFDKLDRKVHEFLKAVETRGPEQRLLQRGAARVSAADDELHFVLSEKDTSKGMAKQLLERQASALVTAARQLDRTGGYTLGGIQGKGVLVADLHKVAQAAEHFQKKLASGMDRPQQLKEFATLTQAWERAVHGLEDVRAAESMYLFRAAGKVDRCHERLHHLLGVKSERPRLILRT